MKFLTVLNAIIAFTFLMVPSHARDVGQACVATFLPQGLLALWYLLNDVCLTLGGLYLFVDPFLKQSEKKGEIIYVKDGKEEKEEIQNSAPVVGCEQGLPNHVPRLQKQQSTLVHDMKVRSVVKWNFIGVLFGQIPTSIMTLLNLILNNDYSYLKYRRLLLKPFANFCNVIGIALMFRDHQIIYAKFLCLVEGDVRVAPSPPAREE
eukprot:CAMPEP_0117774398 /NCGR_PEP_ID=MMETSP0947-20121206/26491_1 /TAXON_ID=44440 /ORGANISM="Chattonella subsalsa, Strain CCMP2191" /LENGTH=205 /DNA_ID=CAMNT_0005600851 /DNA_START=298 /DNA_END=915 /DNA_ORIENTATION=-